VGGLTLAQLCQVFFEILRLAGVGSTVVNPDSTVVNPDWTVVNPDSMVVNPDWTVVNPDSMVVNPRAFLHGKTCYTEICRKFLVNCDYSVAVIGLAQSITLSILRHSPSKSSHLTEQGHRGTGMQRIMGGASDTGYL